MSQSSDHAETLKRAINRHISNYDVVIDVFIETVSNQDWDSGDIIIMLGSSSIEDEEEDDE
jgi:hypothetical protein